MFVPETGVSHASFGWEHLFGRKGTSEELCYRTSLSLTFPTEIDVEVDKHGLAYSCDVEVIREGRIKGYTWPYLSRPEESHVVSAVNQSLQIYCIIVTLLH